MDVFVYMYFRAIATSDDMFIRGTRLRTIGSFVTHGHRHYPNVHEARMDGTRYMYNRIGGGENTLYVELQRGRMPVPPSHSRQATCHLRNESWKQIPVAQTTQGT